MANYASRLLRAVMVLSLLVLTGCSTTPTTYLSAVAPTTEQLLSGEVLLGKRAESLQFPDEEILSTDPDMLAYVEALLADGGSSAYRARALAESMMSPAQLGIEYMLDQSHNARDTFHLRRGNCISFTNLYIALARSAGLKASYQQAYVAPLWEQKAGVTLLLRHINIVVHLPSDQALVVDFEQTALGPLFNHEKLRDSKAFALFYSNIGVEYMLAGNTYEAFRYLAQAVRTDISVGAAWVNLAALYSRNGHKDMAEAAYLEALRRDPREALTYSNLANLYHHAGLDEPALAIDRRAKSLQRSNPYYHFAQAKQAHRQGEFEESNRHLQRAIKLKSGDPLFQQLRSKNDVLLSRQHGEGKQS